MRSLAIIAVAALAGCSAGRDTFVIEDPQQVGQSANLKLCGNEQLLERDGSRFSARHTVGCEGAGVIEVRYLDGRTVNCEIGYVTAGVEQRWHFRLRPGSCEQPAWDRLPSLRFPPNERDPNFRRDDVVSLNAASLRTSSASDSICNNV